MLSTKNIIITSGISDKIKEDIFFKGFVNRCIGRHFKLDFGDIDEHDKEVNLKGVRFGGRVMSVYNYNEYIKIYVVTEADRSVTTILLPEEY